MKTQPRSLADMLLQRVAATPEREALRYPTNPGWASLNWREAGARVRAIASGLRALGLDDQQRCAILSSTRYEWVLMDFGILAAGGATTTVYPSNTPDECRHILIDSDTKMVFVENWPSTRRSSLSGRPCPGCGMSFSSTASRRTTAGSRCRSRS